MKLRSPILFIALSMISAVPGCTSGADRPSSEAKKSPSDPSETGSSGKDDASKQGELKLPVAPVGFVQGKEVSYETFLTLYKAKKAKNEGKKVGDSVELRTQATIVDRLIREDQLRLEAKAAGVDYDPAELKKLDADQAMSAEERSKFLAWMAETEETVRERNIADLRERALVKASAEIEASEAEIDEAYALAKPNLHSDEERVRASHVFVAIGPREGKTRIRRQRAEVLKNASEEELAKWKDAALARAKELRELLVAPGADFNELAKKLSEGPGAYRGGDMGVFDRRRMVKNYADTAFAMKVGEISEPIVSSNAVYIIKLFDRHKPGTLSKEAIRDDLVRNIENREYSAARKVLRAKMDAAYKPENLLTAKAEAAKAEAMKEKRAARAKKAAEVKSAEAGTAEAGKTESGKTESGEAEAGEAGEAAEAGEAGEAGEAANTAK